MSIMFLTSESLHTKNVSEASHLKCLQSTAQPFHQESWFLSCRLRLTEAKVLLVYVILVSVPTVLLEVCYSTLWSVILFAYDYI